MQCKDEGLQIIISGIADSPCEVELQVIMDVFLASNMIGAGSCVRGKCGQVMLDEVLPRRTGLLAEALQTHAFALGALRQPTATSPWPPPLIALLRRLLGVQANMA